jgi:hypothetical protein
MASDAVSGHAQPLGLTVNSARYHDHKFDPIPASDYYSIKAVLQGVQHGERPLNTTASNGI